ncbi:MAG: hypothetical protein RLZZ262_2159 [Bacteroidota bacterium]|jgi:hypothetical protein
MARIELSQVQIQRFYEQGEKTSWSYIPIEAALAIQLHDSDRKSFRGKGTIDGCAFAQIALMPMGGGDYILPLNANIRKSIGKKPGDVVHLILEKDTDTWQMNEELEACLLDLPDLHQAFVSLPQGHQRYFSNWIESTKNPQLRADRIAKTMYAIEHKLNYGEMIRHFKK